MTSDRDQGHRAGPPVRSESSALLPSGRILVIDDDPAGLKVIGAILARDGWEVDLCLAPCEGLAVLDRTPPSCVIVDFKMPEMTGLEFLQSLREQGHRMPVILITAFGSVKLAVEAMKKGAWNYLTKPLDFDELRLLVQQAANSYQTQAALDAMRRAGPAEGARPVLGKSRPMREVFRLVETAGDSDANVLLLGETGTGKEIIARALHARSARSHRPFIAVSCAALPETLLEGELFGHEKGAFTGATSRRKGIFEAAHQSTLFLDEIGEVPPSIQTKLLRVLQERTFTRLGSTRPIEADFRLIAATNRDLRASVRTGEFREDLYFRLNVIPIELPPLRERTEDIPDLLAHFLARSGAPDLRFSPKAMSALLSYSWPGNVRELENVVERCAVMTKGGLVEDVPLPRSTPSRSDSLLSMEDLEQPLKELEKRLLTQLEQEYLDAILARYHGNVGLAADHCGITRRSLYEKMKALDLHKEDYKRRS